MSAELAAGGRLVTVLDRHGLSEPRWRSVQSIWLVRLAEEAGRQRFRLNNRYQKAFLHHMQRLEKSPPKRDTQPPGANGNQLPFQAPAAGAVPRQSAPGNLPFQAPAAALDGSAPTSWQGEAAAPSSPGWAASGAAPAPTSSPWAASGAGPAPSSSPWAAQAPQPSPSSPWGGAYAQPAASWAAAAGAYAPHAPAPAPAPSMDLAHFAALTAEVTVHPHALDRARSRYGLDDASHHAVARAWQARFGADPALYQQYTQLFAHYHAWFAQQGG